MKTIGLLGGMSWESTALYYRELNEGVNKNLGGNHSAQIVMLSFDFGIIERMQSAGDIEGSAKAMVEGAKQVEAAGADFLLICTNTMHEFVPDIELHCDMPILHIADATADAIKAKGIKKVGLLGTKFTMERDFYKGRLKSKYGIDVVIPCEQDRKIVHDVIYNELCRGNVEENSRIEYLRVIENLAKQGAEAVILGCTEITMLVKQSDTNVTLLDTTAIHAEKAVEFALS